MWRPEPPWDSCPSHVLAWFLEQLSSAPSTLHHLIRGFQFGCPEINFNMRVVRMARQTFWRRSSGGRWERPMKCSPWKIIIFEVVFGLLKVYLASPTPLWSWQNQWNTPLDEAWIEWSNDLKKRKVRWDRIDVYHILCRSHASSRGALRDSTELYLWLIYLITNLQNGSISCTTGCNSHGRGCQ